MTGYQERDSPTDPAYVASVGSPSLTGNWWGRNTAVMAEGSRSRLPLKVRGSWMPRQRLPAPSSWRSQRLLCSFWLERHERESGIAGAGYPRLGPRVRLVTAAPFQWAIQQRGTIPQACWSSVGPEPVDGGPKPAAQVSTKAPYEWNELLPRPL